MPEFPEIFSRASELQTVLPGKQFIKFEIIQPKSLNVPQDEFLQALTSAEVIRVLTMANGYLLRLIEDIYW